MEKHITTESVTAHAMCSRRAFFLFRGEPEASSHEYERALDERAERRRLEYLRILPGNELPAFQKNNTKIPITRKFDPVRIVTSERLVATCDALCRKSPGQGKAHACYEPHLVVGTHTVNQNQKLALAYAGYVIGQTKRYLPSVGFIVPIDSRPKRIHLSLHYSNIRLIVTELRQFLNNLQNDPPPLYLTHNCVTCPFHDYCLREAEVTDNLTLLERMSPKLLRRYEKKGVFTVNQLSYLFRPRRRRKRSSAAQPSFNIEMQALAIRANKIYLHELPTLKERPVELYLDIEGIPDQDFQYLIGLLIKSRDSIIMRSFWANTVEDELRIFRECIEAANHWPDCPIYHYRSYELRAFQNAATKYELDFSDFLGRLVNVNTFIFGKIYFPTRSNRLKDLGAFVGARWSARHPSGLQSIAWRYRWEDTGEDKYKKLLLSYNHEDCQAVHLLTQELQNLAIAGNSRPDVDVPTNFKTKTSTTETGQVIHDTFDRILKSAHLRYKEKQIQICPDEGNEQRKTQLRCGHSHRTQDVFSLRSGRIIRIPRKRKCEKCQSQTLRKSKKIVEHAILDLSFTKSGCRKTVIKYIGNYARCPVCGYCYTPPGMKRLRGRLFGRNFQCWTTYLRVALRMPVRVISEVIDAMFSEHVGYGTITEFVSGMAREYQPSENLLIERLLESPVIHADETKISIRGISHYAWVLTDGKHVIFMLSDTRQISTIELLLSGYNGVLVSDFYPGYDSLPCRQQKCLVHLIRDLNDDLWSNPFNEDYECFVAVVRDLLVPIFEDVNRWGLKARFLRKHMKSVDRFYDKVIKITECRSELVEKYKKRFTRYRESLFLFLKEDGIPWNNNMAERGLRHLLVQQKISGCFVGSGASDYLRLLGIAQTCRFQGKPFLHFMLSGEKDVDQFKIARRYGKKV